MTYQKELSSESRLNNVKSEFEIWRTTRTSQKPIPSYLWDMAVDLYPALTVNKICSTLSLSYTGLKQRVEQKSKQISVRADAKPAFIELEFPQPSVSISECVVEMEQSGGAKLRICFRGKPDIDLLELCNSFWRRQA